MDVISQDQRGDDSSPEVSPLSLDRQTITPKPQLPEEEKQLSRRDLFSFGNFMKSAAELDVKPIEETEEEDEGGLLPAVGLPTVAMAAVAALMYGRRRG